MAMRVRVHPALYVVSRTGMATLQPDVLWFSFTAIFGPFAVFGVAPGHESSGTSQPKYVWTTSLGL
jgi:hypothetical protein